MNIPTFTPHALREILVNNGITLSQLRVAMGGKPSESRLSFFLTGKKIMPQRIELAIRAAMVTMGVL